MLRDKIFLRLRVQRINLLLRLDGFGDGRYDAAVVFGEAGTEWGPSIWPVDNLDYNRLLRYT